MGMTTIVRLECDMCSSHRDLTVGNTEDLGISSGLPMLIRWRANAIGWRINVSNADKLCVCERCNLKPELEQSVSMRETQMPSGRY